MHPQLWTAATVLAGAAQLVSAQTFTSCNPLEKTCPPDPALGKTVTVDFTQGANSDVFFEEAGTTLTYDDTMGAVFTINTAAQAPTIATKDYIFFGNVELVLQAAPGAGIVSSFVMQSDDLDEVDWEWLNYNSTAVETNYFGKGNTTSYDRATYDYGIDNPQSSFHTYTIDWTSERLEWSIDGSVVRTLAYADANGGANYPQTPMQIKLGNWCGGGPDEPQGTVEWAGGYTDFSQAPFIMYVKSIKITDYSTGATSYTYGDNSGSYESIVIDTNGSSDSSSSAVSSSTTATSTKHTSATATHTSADATTTSHADSVSTSSALSFTPSSVSSMTGSAGTASASASMGMSTSVLPGTTIISSSSTGTATASAASTTVSDSAAGNVKPSRYGVMDGAVVVAGLILGAMVM